MIGNCAIMAVVNLTPDSFYPGSRAREDEVMDRIRRLRADGADIIDLGAVSSRPGAGEVDADQEWRRLRGTLERIRKEDAGAPYSIDTTRAEIVRRAYDIIGPFTVNDISAGEADREMLPTAGELGLDYIAMHRRGTPETMDSLCNYPRGVVEELLEYFGEFGRRAAEAGIRRWILDPGLGFAKTPSQCVEILRRLPELKAAGVPVLVGAADKRFTLELAPTREEGTRVAHRMALRGGADLLRLHELKQII